MHERVAPMIDPDIWDVWLDVQRSSAKTRKMIVGLTGGPWTTFDWVCERRMLHVGWLATEEQVSAPYCEIENKHAE